MQNNSKKREKPLLTFAYNKLMKKLEKTKNSRALRQPREEVTEYLKSIFSSQPKVKKFTIKSVISTDRYKIVFLICYIDQNNKANYACLHFSLGEYKKILSAILWITDQNFQVIAPVGRAYSDNQGFNAQTLIKESSSYLKRSGNVDCLRAIASEINEEIRI